MFESRWQHHRTPLVFALRPAGGIAGAVGQRALDLAAVIRRGEAEDQAVARRVLSHLDKVPVAEPAFEKRLGKRVLDHGLDHPLQRPRAELRVIAPRRQPCRRLARS